MFVVISLFGLYYGSLYVVTFLRVLVRIVLKPVIWYTLHIDIVYHEK